MNNRKRLLNGFITTKPLYVCQSLMDVDAVFYPLVWQWRRGRGRTGQVRVVHQVSIVAHAALDRKWGRSFALISITRPVQLQICVETRQSSVEINIMIQSFLKHLNRCKSVV